MEIAADGPEGEDSCEPALAAVPDQLSDKQILPAVPEASHGTDSLKGNKAKKKVQEPVDPKLTSPALMKLGEHGLEKGLMVTEKSAEDSQLQSTGAERSESASSENRKQQLAAKKRKRRPNKTGFPSVKVKKKKLASELISSTEPAEQKLPSAVETSVAFEIIGAVPSTSVEKRLDPPESKQSPSNSIVLPATPKCEQKDRLQLKRSLSSHPAVRGRPPKRPRGGRQPSRPRDGSMAQTAVLFRDAPTLGGVSISNTSSSVEPSPASSDVESLDYRYEKLFLKIGLIPGNIMT
jgi:hypothetical protein